MVFSTLLDVDAISLPVEAFPTSVCGNQETVVESGSQAKLRETRLSQRFVMGITAK